MAESRPPFLYFGYNIHMILSITEAERQVLIALVELGEPVETPNNTHYRFYPKTLEAAAEYFRSLRVDWTAAYALLASRGLLERHNGSYRLTEAGARLARQERLDHPPIWYWYREYYSITQRSPAYSAFCEALYGRDLCQTNFSDMAQINFLAKIANLQPGQRVLDLGCGKGLFAEYLSNLTGARVWGLDYTPEAVQQALERTAASRNRLDFCVGNFDHLDQAGFADGSFNLITSIDTLYMPNDLRATLRTLRRLLAPGGRILAFYLSLCFDPNQPRDGLQPNDSELAIALRQEGFTYRTWDFSGPTYEMMQRKHRLAESMRPLFAAEGTLFLYDHLMAESEASPLPYNPSTATLSRYLYEILPGAVPVV